MTGAAAAIRVEGSIVVPGARRRTTGGPRRPRPDGRRRRDRRADRAERLAASRRCCASSPDCSPRNVARSTLDGEPIAGPDPRIGLVFQEPRLLPWRSAADNITYPLELAGWPARPTARAARRTRSSSSALEPARLGNRPSELSGGHAPAGRPRPRARPRARRAPARRAVQRARRAEPRALRPRAARALGACADRRSCSSPTASPRRSSWPIGWWSCRHGPGASSRRCPSTLPRPRTIDDLDAAVVSGDVARDPRPPRRGGGRVSRGRPAVAVGRSPRCVGVPARSGSSS